MTDNTLRATAWGKLLDVAVVIVGITIAFQVDRWKAGSDRASREESYLHGLMTDINKDIKEYEDNIAALDRDRQLIYRSLIRLTKGEDTWRSSKHAIWTCWLSSKCSLHLMCISIVQESC